MGDLIVAGFPITGETNLRRTFRHMDVAFEVTNHGRSEDGILPRPQGTWCYYIYVLEQMMRPEDFAEFWLAPDGEFAKNHPNYPYMEAKFANADWHCGITYYSKERGFDGEPRCVKLGCDYAHYWDDGHYFDLESVKRDAEHTIDMLREFYTFYRHDPYNGVWLPAEQMVEHKGQLYSPDGLKEVLKWDAEREAKLAGVIE